METKSVFSTRFMVRTAIFASIATILYFFPRFPLPFFLGFLEMHFDEVPALIATFAYGPMCGSFVILIKTIIKLFFTTTMGVGEVLDLIYGLALIIPAGLIYKKNRTMKGAIKGLIVSNLIHLFVSFTLSATVVIDVYAFFLNMDKEAILHMAQALAPVKDLNFSIAFYCFLPFNIFKDVVIAALTILLYPRVRFFTEKRYKK